MDLTPMVETAEISDAHLDNISGGMAGGASTGLVSNVSTGLTEPLTAVASADVWATVSPQGVTAGATINVAGH